MNEQELKEYESYIEMMCKYIYYYPDFDNNIRDLTKIVDEISERIPAFQYDYYIKKNNLTYLDIINLGREVLLTIDKDLNKENNEKKLIKRKYSNWQVKTCLFYNEIL